MNREQFKAAVEYNQKKWDAGEVSMEQYTALVYSYQLGRSDLEDDAKGGPLTLGTLDELMVQDNPPVDGDGNVKFENWDGPLDKQPRNRKEVYAQFGNPGWSEADKAWAKQNIMYCHESLGTRLPGIPKKWWVAVHKDVEPYLREALRRTQVACPDYVIERIGCYNWRPIRYKVGNPLSMHSWAIAVDINPQYNFTKTFEKGKAPKAWSEEYYKIWPEGKTVPPGLVQAFSSCGFAWGSDWDEDGISHDHTFYDPMHFEFVARDGNANGV
jgi:hypothetical protein